jgi:hypothetical protein
MIDFVIGLFILLVSILSIAFIMILITPFLIPIFFCIGVIALISLIIDLIINLIMPR